jgi:tetraacyldisaccharide 4'-kinase
MKPAVERWLADRWYGPVAPGLGLRALAGLYRLFSRPESSALVERLSTPVIVVGNFTVGGTGKTPLVIALAEHFSNQGFHPGIISRGYGRESSLPVRVSSDMPASLCGDEPKLMFEKTGLPVLVDSDRVAAARSAISAGCGLIIADDGLQHRRLARDIEIEVLDGQRRYGNGLLLPAGPLREAPRKCDFRVVNGSSTDDGDWTMTLQLGDAVSLDGSGARRPLSGFAVGRVDAVAGIGNPARFFAALRSAGVRPVEHAFPDHYVYGDWDFRSMSGPVLMTEKDAVKCRDLGLADAWSVPVHAIMPPAFFAEVEKRLKESHAHS